MPLIFTPQYIIAVAVAVFVTLIAKHRGARRGLLWPLSTIGIIITLWLAGFHPLGFLVSAGGWIMLLVTVLIGWCIQALVWRRNGAKRIK
jgi:hypothetical protein